MEVKKKKSTWPNFCDQTGPKQGKTQKQGKTIQGKN
jgi:hypothetical protein